MFLLWDSLVKRNPHNNNLNVKYPFTCNIPVNTVRVLMENSSTLSSLFYIFPLFISLSVVASRNVCVWARCTHHWINAICIPYLEFAKNMPLLFPPLEHRLDHQLLMVRWKINYSLGLGCIGLVFLCRHMSCCPPWLCDNSWGKKQTSETDDNRVAPSFLVCVTTSGPMWSAISPIPQY